MDTYTLQLVPKGWKVVPVEPTDDQIAAPSLDTPVAWIYRSMVDAAPPLNTPPVLRWEGNSLIIGNTRLASIGDHNGIWYILDKVGVYGTEQEARRAAEKALGFPDGMIIEEV